MFVDHKDKLPSTLTICLLHNAKLTERKKGEKRINKRSPNLSLFLYWVQYSLGTGDCYVLSVATQ